MNEREKIEHIIELMESGYYSEALTEIEYMQNEEADTLAVLKAGIYERMGDSERLFDTVREGLRFNPENGELYFILGNYYSLYNANQAYLCFENACHYLKEDADRQLVKEKMKGLIAGGQIMLHPVSIVILSYNTLEYTKRCIESIRATCAKDAYELVVVDNASSDGSVEWLMEQNDIRLFCAKKNEGFPRGCNIGVRMATSENDVLFLNSDTLMVENSLFYLRLALYSDENIGAAGSVTSMAGNWQMIEKRFDTLDAYLQFGRTNNIPDRNAIEGRVKLSGFAMLVKRKALDLAGIFDECFSPGNYEDDDLSLRLLQAGFRSVLCHNSFIFHYGSISFGREKEKYVGIVEQNKDKFIAKWGFETSYYAHCKNYIFSFISETDPYVPLRILDVGCGLGATMLGIQFRFPNAQVSGIEINGTVAGLAGKILDVLEGDIQCMELPYLAQQFDYIIFSDVLEHLRAPEQVLRKMKRYLKDSGTIIASIPNIMHISVLEQMIKGTIAYQESGILDKTHLRFFTLDSIPRLAEKSGLLVKEIVPGRNAAEESESSGVLLGILCSTNEAAERERFLTYQYAVAFALPPKRQAGRARKQRPYEGTHLLIYQADSPYGALSYFMEQLLFSFHSLGVRTTVVDLDEKGALETIVSLHEQNFDAVLSFNCFISNIKLQDGTYLQDYIQAPYYYFLLDHPMHHHAVLKEHIKYLHAICVDEFFVDYIQRYYPHVRSVHMIPHGGCSKGKPLTYADRQIDVLFTGTYKPCDELLQIMKDSDELASKISIALSEEILSHPCLRQEEAFMHVLQDMKITVTEEQFAEWLSVVGNIVDHYVRGIYRNRLLETMAGQDFCVEVYGEGWENCDIQADNIHYHSAVGFKENLELMNQAKVVINTYTGFKAGAHERVFSTMLSKALCLSERNSYLESLFQDGEEILFFDYSNTDSLTDILQHYLTDAEQAERITERAYSKVCTEHTWKERAKEILQVMAGVSQGFEGTQPY